jgi:hypothetical protein
VAGQAGRRLVGGLGSMGNAVGAAVGSAAGQLVSQAAQGAIAAALGKRPAGSGVAGILRGMALQAVAAVKPRADAGAEGPPAAKARRALAAAPAKKTRKPRRSGGQSG